MLHDRTEGLYGGVGVGSVALGCLPPPYFFRYCLKSHTYNAKIKIENLVKSFLIFEMIVLW